MDVPVILGLDLGSRKTGWCVGDGSSTPKAGAWVFPQVGEDLGILGSQFLANLRVMHQVQRVTHVIYEAPFVDRYRDKVLTLRKLLGMGFAVETYCAEHELVCEEEPFGPIKRELAGFAGAGKDDMVYAARKLGVALPETLAAGQQDAADAVGAWLVGVRLYAKGYAAEWDRRLYSRRGHLL